jgi:hypothetical protein
VVGTGVTTSIIPRRLWAVNTIAEESCAELFAGVEQSIRLSTRSPSLGLHAVAAHLHAAPRAGTVFGTVVESPAATVFSARLKAAPRPLRDGIVGNPKQLGNRCIGTRALAFEDGTAIAAYL